MKCPVCLGKGYATDEDIKEYPHRCPNCDGKGFYSVDWQKVRCEVCNGSGKKPMTNEEWFATLSTEEKAKWLYDHYVNARAEEFYGRPEKTLYDYQKWLVGVHKGIDGTKID